MATELRDPYGFDTYALAVAVVFGPLFLLWALARRRCPGAPRSSDHRRLDLLAFAALAQGSLYYHNPWPTDQQPLIAVAIGIQALFYLISAGFMLREKSAQLVPFWRGALIGQALILAALTRWPWTIAADYLVQLPTPQATSSGGSFPRYSEGSRVGRYAKDILVVAAMVAVIALIMSANREDTPVVKETPTTKIAHTPAPNTAPNYTMMGQRIGQPPVEVKGAGPGTSRSWVVVDGVVVSVAGGSLVRDGVVIIPREATLARCEEVFGPRRVQSGIVVWHISDNEDLILEDGQLTLCQAGRAEKLANARTNRITIHKHEPPPPGRVYYAPPASGALRWE